MGPESPRSIHLHDFRNTDKNPGLEMLGCGEKRELGTPFGADCGGVRGQDDTCCCYSDCSGALFRPALSAAETGQLCSSVCFHNAALNTVLI